MKWTDISDHDLDHAMKLIIEEQPFQGYRNILDTLRYEGINVPRERGRRSIHRVDPEGKYKYGSMNGSVNIIFYILRILY
jgi:hypothetical protein